MILALLLTCTPPAPDAPVKVSFKPGATVEELARFATATLCASWEVPLASRKRALKLSADGEVPGRQVAALVQLLAGSAGVDGPGLEASCAASAIGPIDSWTRKVPAAARDQLLECVLSQVRIVPNPSGGFKLFGIRQGSLPEALAFQNGDVVLSVNGAEPSLDAWAKLNNASELRFAVLRKSEPRLITWLLK